MDPLWILIAGMLVVVGGILTLRLHPFLALLLAAILVALITPDTHLESYAKEKRMSPEASAEFLKQSSGERIAKAFGTTCGKVGILIALASIIGRCLLESGAAERIVRSALRVTGESRAPAAFATSGFVLGTPVFFDTVFYLMIPLGKALACRTQRNYGLYVMSIIAGATMAHSLVPPTPGPLFVASQLQVDLGAMILGGLAVGLVTVTAGSFYAHWINRRWPVPLRHAEDPAKGPGLVATMVAKKDAELPGLFLSLLPIVLPVVLIASGTVLKTVPRGDAVADLPSAWIMLGDVFRALGNPNLALALSAVLALGITHRVCGSHRKALSNLVGGSLSSAGIIILITSAGGAFGGVLQQTGIALRIQDLAETYHVAILPLAFLVTTLVRTAQGSATVAMITAVGMLGGMAENLAFHPVYLALAIGCGSKPFPWMNDSGFWVINQLSGLTLPETFRSFSGLLTLMGLTGLVVVMLAAWLLPWVSPS